MIGAADLLAILGITVLCAVVAAAVGMLGLRLARRAPLWAQLSVVVLTGMLSVAAGMIAVARAMYLSPHDLIVGMWVAAAATAASFAAVVVLARSFARRTENVRRIAAGLGEGVTVSAPSPQSDRSELARVEAELARASRRLQEARDEVDALDRSRRELIAWISHDLRTPLAGLRAMAEALEDGMAEDPQRFHRQMRSQIDHLSDLVDDLFELSKIQSGRLVLQLETVSLHDVVSDAVAELHALAAERSITIREAPTPDLEVRADARELARVVGNLLVNAIQHSPPGSGISVTTETDHDGNAVLSVIDAGDGIPEDDIDKVFLPGWRSTPSRTPDVLPGRSSGAGLGLSIARGIVEAHAGAIRVHNVHGGCRFDVLLPRTVAA